jgi:AcrR family transcriptional regulator
MLDATAGRGYAKTTVADVMRGAGVSRREFYERFPTREQCFLATIERTTGVVADRVAKAYTASTNSDDALYAMFRTFMLMLRHEEAAARAVLIAAPRMGSSGRAALARSSTAFELMIILALTNGERASESLDTRIASAIVGGARRVARAQLTDRLLAADVDVADELTRWTLAYRRALRAPRPTLLTAPTASQQPDDAPPAAGAQPRGHVAPSDVTLEQLGEPGRPGARESPPELERACLAILAHADSGARAAITAACAENESWPRAARLRAAALLDYFEQQTNVTRFAFTLVFAAGERAVERQEALAGKLAAALTAGAPPPFGNLALINEAIAGALEEILYRHAFEGTRGTLVEITRPFAQLVAAPFTSAVSRKPRQASTG